MTDETSDPKGKKAKVPAVWDPAKAERCSLYPLSQAEFDLRQEQMRQHVRDMTAAGKWGRKRGVPDGWAGEKRRALLIKTRNEAAIIADKIVEHMKKNEIVTIDDERAEMALETLVEVMIAKNVNEQGFAKYAYADKDRLTAAQALLKYTKQGPTTKAELAVTTAEDFLAAIAHKV